MTTDQPLTAYLTTTEYRTTLTSIGRAFAACHVSDTAADVSLVLARTGARDVHYRAFRLYLGAIGWPMMQALALAKIGH